jgi:hypothetical protein
MKKLIAFLLLFVVVCPIWGKRRKDVPPAPLPAVVINGKEDISHKWGWQQFGI